jgi:hypothetical protein
MTLVDTTQDLTVTWTPISIGDIRFALDTDAVALAAGHLEGHRDVGGERVTPW